MRFTYAEPGYYWDGRPCPGLTPGGSNLFRYVTNHPGRLSLLPSMGLQNMYQPKGGDALRLGSKGRHGVICR